MIMFAFVKNKCNDQYRGIMYEVFT